MDIDFFSSKRMSNFEDNIYYIMALFDYFILMYIHHLLKLSPIFVGFGFQHNFCKRYNTVICSFLISGKKCNLVSMPKLKFKYWMVLRLGVYFYYWAILPDTRKSNYTEEIEPVGLWTKYHISYRQIILGYYQQKNTFL